MTENFAQCQKEQHDAMIDKTHARPKTILQLTKHRAMIL